MIEEIPFRRDGSQASILSEAPLKSIIGSPLPNILYATSISPTGTFFKGVSCIFTEFVVLEFIWPGFDWPYATLAKPKYP